MRQRFACESAANSKLNCPTKNRWSSKRFRHATVGRFCRGWAKSWIFDRSFTKPRGYPGDYQLLTAIYEGVAKSIGFGGYVDRYLLNLTLGRAVPARMWDARRFLMEEISRRRGRVAILNVACGCCREYRGGFETSPERTTTHDRRRQRSGSARLCQSRGTAASLDAAASRRILSATTPCG